MIPPGKSFFQPSETTLVRKRLFTRPYKGLAVSAGSIRPAPPSGRESKTGDVYMWFPAVSETRGAGRGGAGI